MHMDCIQYKVKLTLDINKLVENIENTTKQVRA